MKRLFRKFRLWVIRHLCCKQALLVDKLSSICILAPHPDDETLGCGQLIYEICHNGGDCQVIVISDGEGSHRGCCKTEAKDIVEGRKASCRMAMEKLGLPAENLKFLGIPDGELLANEDIIFDRVKQILGNFHGILLVPHEQEGWKDHLTVHHVGKRIAEKTGCHLLFYCVWFYFSMPFRKFLRVIWSSARILRCEEALEKKRLALSIYQNEKAPCGKPYAGVLPDLLWKAVNDEREVYFEE